MKRIIYYEVDWHHEARRGVLTLHYASTDAEAGGLYSIDNVTVAELDLLTVLLRKHPKVTLDPASGNICFDKHKVGDDT